MPRAENYRGLYRKTVPVREELPETHPRNRVVFDVIDDELGTFDDESAALAAFSALDTHERDEFDLVFFSFDGSRPRGAGWQLVGFDVVSDGRYSTLAGWPVGDQSGVPATLGKELDALESWSLGRLNELGLFRAERDARELIERQQAIARLGFTWESVYEPAVARIELWRP